MVFNRILPLALVACAGFSPAQAQGVPAGTVIESTAEASFSTPSGVRTTASNPVQLVVNEVLAVAITTIDAGPVNSVSQTAVLTFELTNIGNAPEAFRLVGNPAVSGNDFELSVIAMVLDANGNGVLDPDIDTVLPDPPQLPELPPGESVTIFVETSVPTAAPIGGASRLALRAEALTGTGAPGTVIPGQGAAGTDAIVGVSSGTALASGTVLNGAAAVALTKTASVRDQFGGTSTIPGATITYTIVAEVSGAGAVSDLVVTDAIPEGSIYSPGTLSLDGSPLTDAAGDDSGEASASGIAVTFASVAAGTQHSLSFEVTIE